MRIIDDVQLDFNDVLFQPKRSTLNSRSEANTNREYHFKWYPKTIVSNGIMAANMATTGTFEMNDVLEKYNSITCLHKHYPKEDIVKYFSEKEHPLTFVSTGLKDSKEDLFRMLKENPNIDKVCVDIANGYIPKLLNFVKELRNNFPNILIMAGNVVTPDITQDLIMAGADIVKCGIGPGCFTRNMKIKTKHGYVKIGKIQEGEEVLTHTGQYKKVINKFEFVSHKERMTINGIECTPTHKFYVVNKSDAKYITDDNYTQYAYWTAAKDLDVNKQLLVKIR